MAWGERAAKVTYRASWRAWAAAQRPPKIQILHQHGMAIGGGVREFVHQVAEPAYIEPEFGYVMTERGHLLEQALTPNFEDVIAPWRVATPSPWRFLSARRHRSTRIREFDRVISLRHLWEWNYYHFYLDALGKLSLLDEIGVDPSIPIVLGRYALELPFVRQVINRGNLRNRIWVIPETEYIRAQTMIYCRTGQPYRSRLDWLLDQMEIPVPTSARDERLFLTRGKGGTRRILNEDAVLSVLEEYGFRSVDTTGMNIDEQVGVFSRARYLVAAHGAGITNIIYRRTAPLGVLELHGSGHISQDFWRICAGYDHWWDHLAGEPDGPDPKHANFEIPIDKLREKLSAMLEDQVPDQLRYEAGLLPCTR